MAVNSQSLLVNKLTAIALIVVGFLILASGYRYGSSFYLVGGCLILAIGLVLLVLKIVRRNNSGAAG